MKAVFICEHHYIFHLKDGTIVESKYGFGRSMYQYSEVPKDETIIYRTWEEVHKNTLYHWDDTTFFTKRKYLNYENLTGKVYEDDFDYLEVMSKYTVIDNPCIELLQKDLGFKGYSELVFDREKELKRMMLNKQSNSFI